MMIQKYSWCLVLGAALSLDIKGISDWKFWIFLISIIVLEMWSRGAK